MLPTFASRLAPSYFKMRRSVIALSLVAGASAFAPSLPGLKLRSSPSVNSASLKMVYGTPRFCGFLLHLNLALDEFSSPGR